MNSWMHVVGWTLIHFAWQGAVVGLLAAGTLRLCQRRAHVLEPLLHLINWHKSI